MDIWVNICVNINKFWYNYVKQRNGQKVKLCYMDTGISLYT